MIYLTDKLNRRDRRFADEYIISLDAEDAAIKAGFAKSTARTKAYQWVDKGSKLAKDSIIAYIDKKLSEIEDEKIADATEVLRYLTAVMRGKETEQTLIMIEKGMQGISEIEVSAKDRIKAAELLGKRYGTWTDKQEIAIKPIIISGDEDLED